MLHEFARWMGLTNPSGSWYSFWSGFAGDLPEFGVFLVVARRLNCHARGCWRIGLHRVRDSHYVTCAKHHPDHAGSKPHTAEQIARRAKGPDDPMSTPQSDHDLLIRMDTKLDVLVGTVNKHSEAIERIDGKLSEHGNRLASLETRDQTEDTHHDRVISSRAAFWTAVGSIILGLSVLVALLVQHK